MSPWPQTAFLMDSRVSPRTCCSEWRLARSQTGSAATREQFRNARTTFHRVVRRCQNQFWSDWQENIASLSRVNPRAAASRVRQMFSGQSGRDDTHLVWPQLTSSEPSRTDIAEQWRQRFVPVGSTRSSMVEVTRVLCAVR